MHHLTTRRLRIVTDETLAINLDGEIATHTPAEVTLEADAVRVMVPQHSRGARLDGPAAGHADTGPTPSTSIG